MPLLKPLLNSARVPRRPGAARRLALDFLLFSSVVVSLPLLRALHRLLRAFGAGR
jgi:hypothetical protein